MLRPRTLARTTKSVEDLVLEMRELKRLSKTLGTDLKRHTEILDALARELRQANDRVNELSVREAQLRAVLEADVRFEDAVASLPSILDEGRIVRHLREAIDRAHLQADPFPHIVVDHVFPQDYYDALLRGMPPGELFGDKTRNKEHVGVPLTVAPAYSRRVWNFLVDELRRPLQTLLVERFREPLGAWLSAQWPALARDPFAPPMEFNITDGRIMRRGRGYDIPPHRDPRWGFLIGILYLARPNDSERWGTQLFAVEQDDDATSAAPHWIEPTRCALVADVPYRPNTMLVMLNCWGAHGAHIPEDAQPADLQRYIYQFRIGPGSSAIRWLSTMLSEEQRPMWAGKVSM